MLNRIKARFKSRTPPTQTAEQAYDLLCNRSSAEIAARLLRRAELFENSKDDFLKRCTALDKVAAEQMERLVGLANPYKDIQPWRDARDNCLNNLREGTN